MGFKLGFRQTFCFSTFSKKMRNAETFGKSFNLTEIENLTNLTITPDPTTGTRDEDFIGFVTLKAACFLDQSLSD